MGDMISPIGLRKKYQQKRLAKGYQQKRKPVDKDGGALALTTPAVTTLLTLIPPSTRLTANCHG
jgi:hypothetical protein